MYDDLIAALDSGQLAYAALDALKPEPLPGAVRLGSPENLLIMPARRAAADGRAACDRDVANT